MIIYNADPDLKEVALIFDDGPNPQVTPQLLTVLKQKKTVANFFLIGAKAEEYPEIARQIAKDGHEIGNHTYTHKRLTQVLANEGKQAVVLEIEKSDAVIKRITGVDRPMFLRPPYLDWNDALSEMVLPMYGGKVVMAGLAIGDWDWGNNHHWSGDDKTAIKAQSAKIVEAWCQATKNGTLLAFHDGSQHNLPGNEYFDTWMNRALPTLDAIPHIIDYLIGQGFAIKRLSDMKLVML